MQELKKKNYCFVDLLNSKTQRQITEMLLQMKYLIGQYTVSV